MDIKKQILNVLNNDVKPAVGCTEPVAIALAAAAASSAIEGKVDKVLMMISPNIYKNGYSVGIPNIDLKGLDVATALGVAKGDYSKKLRILEDISDDERQAAISLLDNKQVEVQLLNPSPKRVYLECIVQSGDDISKAIIEDKHDNITSIKLNGEELIVVEESSATTSANVLDTKVFDKSIYEIVQVIETLEFDDIKHLLDGVEMNKTVSKLGMEKRYGIGIGYAMNENMKKGLISKDLPNMAMIMTGAASDVRMSGMTIPVMSSNGSGNHGLTAIMPIVAYNEMYPTSDEKLAQGLAISHMVTAYIKNYIGRLSSLCGCSIAAATGSACAVTWLMGGQEKELQGTIKNILANQAGVVCDGAKAGCALKLGTAASAGMQSAMLATSGFYVEESNGIVAESAEQAIKNLGSLSTNGMMDVDNAIIDIMVETC